MEIEEKDLLTIKRVIDNLLQPEREDIEPVKSIVVSNFAWAMILAEYEGKRYFVIPPKESERVRFYINMLARNMRAPLDWYSNISILEDDELGKKIIVSALERSINERPTG